MEYISSKIPSLGQNYTQWIIYIKQPFISAMVFYKNVSERQDFHKRQICSTLNIIHENFIFVLSSQII